MLIFIISLIIQVFLFLFFLFFAFYNFRYQIASLFKPKIKKNFLTHNPKVAIVIVSHNEKLVIRETIAACQKLTYINKTIIVGDDSDDPETLEILKNIADTYHCKAISNRNENGLIPYPGVNEAFESEQFVLFHRDNNVGFKAGNIKVIEGYLKAKGFEYMYLLDADWHPEPHAIEKCLEVIEADSNIAFVQTRRNSYYGKGELFKRCLGMMEEACYYVDLVGRQVVGDMILFSGCCALFRLSFLDKVGGFMPGHLTEDIDLSNRFYLAGYKGIYLESVQNTGEVPPNYKAYRKQQDRWAKGSAKVFRDYFEALIQSDKLNIKTKLSIIRQNAYFTVAIGTVSSIIFVLISFLFRVFGRNIGFIPELYPEIKNIVFLIMPLMYLIFLTSILYLVILVIKKREWVGFLYIPLVWWINLSIIHTYFIANIIGFKCDNDVSWFITPKTNRTKQKILLKGDWKIKILNMVSLALMVTMYSFTFINDPKTVAFFLPFAIGWIPAFLIGSIRS